MAARLFQGLILQMKDSVKHTIGVLDSSGTVVACTDLPRIGEVKKTLTDDLSNIHSLTTIKGITVKPIIGQNQKTEYYAFVEGEGIEASDICSVLAVSIGSVRSLYEEKYEKYTFINNILLDNILPGDIYIRAREFHFGSDVPRVCLLIRQLGKPDLSVMDLLNDMFPDKSKDYVININEADIVLVKEVSQNTDQKDLIKLAKNIENSIKSNITTNLAIGIGTIVIQLKDIAKSYKEAQVAIEVGCVFEPEKTIISFDNLGIGRLIYQLPITLCEMFLDEVFRKESIDSLDEETMYSIQKFFENNLNVSETSRKLFVHRNTLVYRLEKIKKLTGMDLREFDQAIIFKVALMVKQYLVSREKYRQINP